MAKQNVKSAKDILLSHDFLEQRRRSAKYVHHEFQDYAYRLAETLGDLEHLPLYMRMAKTVPRHIIERAKAAIIESEDANKGRLFMWKLGQIRAELQLEQDNQNFEYDFVWKRMSKLYNELAHSLLRKYRSELDGDHVQSLLKTLLTAAEELELPGRRRKVAAAVYESYGGYVSDILAKLDWRVQSLEPAREITKVVKSKYSNFYTATTQLTHGKYQEAELSVLHLGLLWTWIPLDQEESIAAEISRVVHPTGVVYLRFSPATRPEQSWQGFQAGEEMRYRFQKLEPIDRLKWLFPDSSWDVIDSGESHLILRRH